MQPQRWKLAIIEADEREANALASRLRDGRFDVVFFDEDDPLADVLADQVDLVLVRQNRVGPGGLMICNRLHEELGARRPVCFLRVDQLTDEAIAKHKEAKGSVDAYVKEWPEPEELTALALEHLQERGASTQSQPPAAHRALNDQVEPEVSLPCLLYTSPSPRDRTRSRMPSSA